MASDNVHNFDDNNFENDVLGASGRVVVDFHATWCGPCKMLAPVVDKIADEFAGTLKVGKVDIEQAPNVAAKFGIRSVPTVMVFENGEVKASHIGLAKREKLVEMAGL